MRNSAQNSSEFSSASILGALLDEPDIKGGTLIATGIDAIVAAFDEIGVKNGSKLPQEFIEDLKRSADMADAELYEMPDGSHIIKGTTMKQAGSVFPDFANFFGSGKPGRTEQAKSPLGEFMQSTKQSLNDGPRDMPKEAGSPTATIMLTSAITAVALTKFGRWQKDTEKAAIAADAFAKLIGDLQAKDPIRFDNLAKYLESYAVNLGVLAEDLRTFAKRPRAGAVDSLVGQLGKLVPILVNVADDAKAKAKEVSDSALAI